MDNIKEITFSLINYDLLLNVYRPY